MYLETKELNENVGNEAKKLLKTNDIAISTTANYTSFARRLAAIGRQNEQKQYILRKTKRSVWIEKQG